MGGGQICPPSLKLNLVLKQVYFSFINATTTNLWLIETFPSLFYKKLWILQPIQNRNFSEKNCRDNFSLGKIPDPRDKYGHKNQTDRHKNFQNGLK